MSYTITSQCTAWHYPTIWSLEVGADVKTPGRGVNNNIMSEDSDGGGESG